MNDVFVAGVSMTAFGKHLTRSIKDLAQDALQGALKDAGAELGDIEAVFYGNCVQGHMDGQDMIRGEIALRAAGLQNVPMINVENACATGSSAFHLAVSYVRSGAADIALAIGVEKMFSADKALMFSAFDGAWDVHQVEQNRNTLTSMGEGLPIPPGTTSDKPYSVFMDVYAGLSRLHMREFGTTQRQIAIVSSKNHQHSTMNPLSQYQRAYSVDEILAAPPITYPLTLPMCSPVSDGAAAAIVCNAAGLKRLSSAAKRAKRVCASVVQTGSNRRAEDLHLHVTARAAKKAYEQAGVGADAMSMAEVHDATAVGEIIEVEALGLCKLGEGGPFAESGATALGGRLPVNPSGGLESKGHPIGATGIAQIYELVTQLRNEAGKRQITAPKFGIAQNGGGICGVEEAVVCVHIVGH
ncbi:MAG: thiolase family protein [Gammaproteobacteria bacterium]|nr:thiolase family protein [Gammaproteobacteria bacterium]MBI5616265.1 thiolase family protein [Gammaproteobacteria bacterium]